MKLPARVTVAFFCFLAVAAFLAFAIDNKALIGLPGALFVGYVSAQTYQHRQSRSK